MVHYAFKDYPLQMLGNLFQILSEKKKKNIRNWRNGDTGSAAIDACKG